MVFMATFVATWVPMYIAADAPRRRQEASRVVGMLRASGVRVRGHRATKTIASCIHNAATSGTVVYALMTMGLGTATSALGNWSTVLAVVDACHRHVCWLYH